DEGILPRAYQRRIIWYDHEEALGHDIGALDEGADEFDVFAHLDLHELGHLLLVAVFQQGNIWPDVELLGLDEDLHREIERVHEALELHQDGVLFILRFEREVERRSQDYGAHAAVLEYDYPVAYFLDGDEILGCRCFL